MFVKLSADTPPELEEADDFKSFRIVGELSSSQLADDFRVDGDHVWVAREWLRRNGHASDPQWVDGLRAMLEFAESKGWTDAEGAVRGHVEPG